MTKAGTPWVTKTPRLHCKCGRVIHFEGKGKWRLVVDKDTELSDNAVDVPGGRSSVDRRLRRADASTDSTASEKTLSISPDD